MSCNAAIERFKAKYLTSGLVGRQFGINSASARRALEQAGIKPVVEPTLFKTFVYLREGVLSVASVLRLTNRCRQEIQTELVNQWLRDRLLKKIENLVNTMLPSGESDASIMDTVNFNRHRNRGIGSKIVKVMLHYKAICVGKDKSHKNDGLPVFL